MKTPSTLAFSVLLFSLATHAETGFTAGNNLKSVVLEGDLFLSCQDPSGQFDSAFIRCREEGLEPAEYSYFTGPKDTNADRVTLHAVREDGSTRDKSEDYDSKSGKSKDSFNLWISTLFQRPLLKMGRNDIEYTLSKDGSPVSTGKFVATVTEGPERQCKYRGHYTSTNVTDCRSGGGPYCHYYFLDQNYCQ